MMSSRFRVRAAVVRIAVTIAGMLAFGSVGRTQTIASKRMPDGKQWTAQNLNVETPGSYCYGDSAANCQRYGRLYTWDAAQQGCQSLGTGWRLPTEDEWRQLAQHYGGIYEEDATRNGKAAYTALLAGGSSGFDAFLGGNRNANDGEYARIEAHGFYWTATVTDPGKAWFYNFGRGRPALFRQRGGERQMAISVRCLKE